MASAKAGRPGQYVKLRKEGKDGDAAPAGTEAIRPGELNQPVRVPEVGLGYFALVCCLDVIFKPL